MKLLTKAIEKKLPALYTNEKKKADQVPVIVKFFNPTGAGTWYATEYSPEDRVFFGFAEIFPGEGELGYFSLDELSEFKGRFGLGIERDLHWNSTTTLADVLKKHGKD